MNKWFGCLAKDKITGFTGIITGKIEWMYGCNQYCLNPKVTNDGELKEANWFDEGRIEIIENFINPDEVKVETNGSDQYNTPRCY